VTDDEERRRLASTFDESASLYQRARPEYPSELYDRLVDVTGLKPGCELLEIGCATGKATLPFARRGFRVTCLEPGGALAAEARRLLAPFDVEVIASCFEDWQAPEGRFSLVYAATAWHWIDPHVRYPKAAQVLVTGGFLAFWEAIHVVPAGGDPFFDEIQEIYDEIGEGRPAGYVLPRPQGLVDQRTDIEASGLFDVVEIRQYDWEVTYDAESYIDLLNTFSGHITMRDWQRDRLYGEIRRRLALRPDGRLRRHWGGVLHIARRRES
jgi:SAM-dependent methyltransferase